ncbi:hypothetical protein GGR52DRAFT_580422 [Hypoxylon sp. FL1284]|nr:hypothetical protein GGR52DRAFT_580422 [Hypoxylon sp. FL1284]
MALKLQDADPATDFPALARAMFESYEEPWQPFFHAYFPIHCSSSGAGGGVEAREAAIAEAAARLANWQRHDATMHWRKVVDPETGDLAAGALWNIHPENPFRADGQAVEAAWFPDDGSRRYAEQLVELHGRPRARIGQRPHVYLFIVFTHPRYRRRGIGQQFMDWGIKKAEDMGVEMFLDATPMGRPLYEKNGFVVVEDNVVAPQTDSPDDAWRETEAKVGPSTHYVMWRPVGGYKKGESKRPWEEKQ